MIDYKGTACELWAIAQGQAPIEDVVDRLVDELRKFATSVERELLQLQEHSTDKKTAR